MLTQDELVARLRSLADRIESGEFPTCLKSPYGQVLQAELYENGDFSVMGVVSKSIILPSTKDGVEIDND